MKNFGKKALSVCLSLMLVLSVLVLPGAADLFVPSASAATPTTTITTQKNAIAGSGDYIKVEYPSDMYVDLGTDLSEYSNYYIRYSGHYGDSTNYRVFVASGTWGGQEKNVTAWGLSGTWAGPYKPANTTLVDAFTDYGIYSKEAAYSGSTGTYGTGSYYSFNLWANNGYQLIYGCENPNNLDMRLYFTGKPAAVGHYTYSSSGSSPLWITQQRSSGSWGSARSGNFDADISFTIHVYDKSALRNAIATADRFIEENYTPQSWAAYRTVYNAAVSVNNADALEQYEIDAAAENLVAAADNLVRSSQNSVIPKWDGTNTNYIMFGNQSGDHLLVTYPGIIYMDITEDLESAGYTVKLSGHYGDSNDYKIIAHDYLWGGSTGTAGYKLSTLFDDYSFDGTVYGVRGVDTGSDQSNGAYNGNANDRIYQRRNTGTLNETIYLLGSPNAVTANDGTVFSTSGASATAVNFAHWNGSGWDTTATFTKADASDSSVMDAGWLEMGITVVVYDKAELRAEYQTAMENVLSTQVYLQYLADGDWTAFEAALTNADNVLLTREVKQDAIDSAAEQLSSAAQAISYAADTTALEAQIAAAEEIIGAEGYVKTYSQATRTALETALNNAAAAGNLAQAYTPYNNTNAGSTAAANQIRANNHKTAIANAIAGLALSAPDFSEYNTFVSANLPLAHPDCYTDASIEAFDSADSAIQLMIADATLTYRDDQADVDTAIDAYVEAYNNLVTEHTFDDWESDGNGGHTRVCSVCNETENGTCNYVGVTTEPDCTNGGFTTYTCSDCGDSYIADETDATGHSWNDGVVTTPPTCTESGVKTFTCAVCFETRTETVNAVGHSYVDTVTPATCTQRGYTTHVCEVCDDTYIDSYTEIIPHTWDDGEIITAPTCTLEGEALFTCTVCGETKTGTVAAAGHTWVAASCTEARTCSVCHESDGEALGHDEIIDEAVEADCLYSGLTQGVHCGRCSEVLIAQEIVDALGHDEVIDEAVEPDCTNTGLTQGSHCSRCDLVFVAQEIVDALGHNVVVDEAVEPDCTNTGLTQGSHCSRCDIIIVAQESVPALGHQEAPVAGVEPTCTETGLTAGTVCERCNEIVLAQEIIPALGHDFTNYEIIEEATCVLNAVEQAHCSRCDAVDTREVAGSALGHSYIDTVIEPTCTVRGMTKHVCSRCNDTYVDTYVDALGHSYGSWVITTEPLCNQPGEQTRTCTRCAHKDTREVSVGHTPSADDPTVCENCGQKISDTGSSTHTGVYCCDEHHYPDTFWGRILAFICRIKQLFTSFMR